MGEYDFVYVHTDIPEGMTIREWRRQRAIARADAETAERAERRAHRRTLITQLLTAADPRPRRGYLRERKAH